MSNRPSVLTGGRNLRAWIPATLAYCNILLHPTVETYATPHPPFYRLQATHTSLPFLPW